MSTNNDYYKTLGISEDATEEEIKKAYKEKARKYHPDNYDSADPKKEEAEKKIRDVTEAYAVLSNSAKRRKYDLTRTSSTTTTTGNSKQSHNPKPNNRDSIFKEHLDRMFNPFGFSNKTVNPFYKDHAEEDYSEIMQIDKKLQETLDSLSNLEAERLQVIHSQLNLQEEYLQKKKAYENRLKSTPDYYNAQNYILKISKKLDSKITKLFISAAEKAHYEKYKQFLNEIEQAIVFKKNELDKEEKTKKEEYQKKEKKVQHEIDNTKQKVNSLRKKYKEHPQYFSYVNYKETKKTSRQREPDSKGSKKVS